MNDVAHRHGSIVAAEHLSKERRREKKREKIVVTCSVHTSLLSGQPWIMNISSPSSESREHRNGTGCDFAMGDQPHLNHVMVTGAAVALGTCSRS